MNKKIAIVPIAFVIIYGLTVWGMIYSEHQFTNLYQQHITFIEKLAQADPFEKKQLAQNFKSQIDLSGTQSFVMQLSAKTQTTLDHLTLGSNHCLTTKETPCSVYTQELIDAAQERQDKILEITKKTPPKEAIVNATTYTPYDYIVKVIILAIEGTLLGMLIAWLTPTIKIKGKK